MDTNGKFWKDKFMMGLMACIGASFIFTASLSMIIWNSQIAYCNEAKAERERIKNDVALRDKEFAEELKLISVALMELRTDMKYVRKEVAR